MRRVLLRSDAPPCSVLVMDRLGTQLIARIMCAGLWRHESRYWSCGEAVPKSIAHYTVLSGQTCEGKAATHRRISGVIVRLIERRHGAGGKMGAGLAGHTMRGGRWSPRCTYPDFSGVRDFSTDSLALCSVVPYQYNRFCTRRFYNKGFFLYPVL